MLYWFGPCVWFEHWKQLHSSSPTAQFQYSTILGLNLTMYNRRRCSPTLNIWTGNIRISGWFLENMTKLAPFSIKELKLVPFDLNLELRFSSRPLSFGWSHWSGWKWGSQKVWCSSDPPVACSYSRFNLIRALSIIYKATLTASEYDKVIMQKSSAPKWNIFLGFCHNGFC